jgi:TetR/AcrR family transcriptional regulator, cholesterol catabolism regulator
MTETIRPNRMQAASRIETRGAAVTQQGEQQRNELLEVAIELFAANGYAGTSIRDIAKLTGRSVSNIYHYFKDKESLWLAILEHSVNGLPEVLRAAIGSRKTPLQRFRALVRAHLQECAKHRREAKIFFIDEERLSPAGKRINKRVQKEIYDIYLSELQQLKSHGLIATDHLRALAFNVLGVINWHLRWLDRISSVSLAETHEEIVEFILNGVCGVRRPTQPDDS